MKKFLLLFILFSSFLVSCNENTVFPLTRVEIYEGGSKVSGIKDIWIGSTYTFTAKFFNSKSQETSAPRPENIFWTTDAPASSSAAFTPSAGTVVSYFIATKPFASTGKIKVEYENLHPYEITIQYMP